MSCLFPICCRSSSVVLPATMPAAGAISSNLTAISSLPTREGGATGLASSATASRADAIYRAAVEEEAPPKFSMSEKNIADLTHALMSQGMGGMTLSQVTNLVKMIFAILERDIWFDPKTLLVTPKTVIRREYLALPAERRVPGKLPRTFAVFSHRGQNFACILLNRIRASDELIAKGGSKKIKRCVMFALPTSFSEDMGFSVKKAAVASQFDTHKHHHEVKQLHELQRCEHIARLIGVFTKWSQFRTKDIPVLRKGIMILEEAPLKSLALYRSLRPDSSSIGFFLCAMENAARGLKEMHAAGKAHMDFKPHNIIGYTLQNWAVCDLGGARSNELLSANKKVKIEATPIFCSPEVAYASTLETKTICIDPSRHDAWSLGASILYLFDPECFVRVFLALYKDFSAEPLDAKHMDAKQIEVDRVIEALLRPDIRHPFYPEILTLIKGLLRIDSSKRMTVGQALEKLSLINKPTSS